MMASKQRLKPNKLGLSSSNAVNSPSSSTTSSSKPYVETSIDGQSSPASSSSRSKPLHFHPDSLPLEADRSKENVTVTVRFRPLSPREIRQGEEIAWYADGETIVRNEHNPSIAYAYDRVFGPTTTTRHVYDVAAQHIVNGAMEGVNGTIFAYGVTSSGKTHTMHGDQRSPGIIPLAVKDAFGIIQETPNREFLLRVSYLEIYNEVVNDLLNPAGQNLRIREDAQGTFVEGVKEEVVLSPAHALSLIAAGEEHRHVGSTNFNIQSSRSHTVFTLTIESSPFGENSEGEAVTLSQLNLIDLAGSESSKVETTGARRKEGSYINKSLLTLGTVISKLTDGRATHIPYRDSKLTRLLQSSLSGHGRVSLICTVTPSSSNSEETHNTLKFAHRAKHIEIQAAQNKIIDEKSLIKKYQNEIRRLKEELDQLKRGIVPVPQIKDVPDNDLVILKQKLEDGQVKLQSRLEQEEEAKAALLGRIQRLTKLILVSTKDSQSSRFPHRAGPRRRHSFGEEELAYLPYKRRDLMLDDESSEVYISTESNVETADDVHKGEKKSKKHGLLNWLKPRKRDSSMGALVSTNDKSSAAKSISTSSTPQGENCNFQTESRHSQSLVTESSPSADRLSETREDRDILGHETPLNTSKSADQVELLTEQHKILSGEVALQTSALRRISEEAARNPQKELLQVEIRNLNEEIKGKNEQIASLEKQIADFAMASQRKPDFEASPYVQSVDDLMAQLNEKSFELEVKAADNRIIQEQLDQKIQECADLQGTVASLKQQLSDALEFGSSLNTVGITSQQVTERKSLLAPISLDKVNAKSSDVNDALLSQEKDTLIEELKQKLTDLTETNKQLEVRNQRLADDSSYAKGLASAAAVELKALSEEVAKLMTQNEKLTAELTALKSSHSRSNSNSHQPPSRRATGGTTLRNGRRSDSQAMRRQDQQGPVPSANDMKKELALSREREMAYEAALLEKDQNETELHDRLEESKQREAYLENELANMWVLVAKLKKSTSATESGSPDITKENHLLEGFGV